MSDAATLDFEEDTTAPSHTKPKEVVVHDHAPMARVDEADPMISMIERIVMDPSVPIERLERMLALKERMEDRAREDDARRAKHAYLAAMATCQAELPVVTRNRENTHTRSRYADLAAIEEQAMPVIHRHGFSTSFWPGGYNDRGEQRIHWRIAHRDGHEESGVGEIPVDKAGAQGKVNKTDTQAFGSTTSYGRRYLLCMLFNISTGDDIDGQKVTEVELITDEQVKELQRLIMEVDADLPKLLSYLRIERLEDIYSDRFDDVKRVIESKRKKGQAS